MNFTKENAVLTSGILVTMFLVGLAMGADTDTVKIDVSITAATLLDVNPNSTTWTGLAIGETSSDQAFIVENIGSNTITSIDTNITGNDTIPYGASDAASFSAGNFIIMNGTTHAGKFFYVYKREWNETVPAYVTPPTTWTAENYNGTFGRFRSAEVGSSDGLEYFWFLNASDDSNCSTGTGVLLIANEKHTKASTGSVDFTNAAKYFTVDLVGNADGYGYGNVSSAGHDLDFYCVRVNEDCSTVDFFHWDNDLDAGSGCNSDEYVRSTALNPGSSFTVYLQARIPFGVADGSASTGTVTFIAAP